MKNKWWIILALVLIVGLGLGVYFITNNNNSESPYTANKVSTENQNSENSNMNNDISNNTENTSKENIINITQNDTGGKIPDISQKLISTFSTKIYSNDPARQNNVVLTCSQLNGAIVPNGTTFSFCNTLGPATPSEGYQEADVFDKDGNKEKGIGGGKCQVSSTLYNAVLSVPTLVVTERHPHSNKVPYVQTGKDAAVSYGSYDLKFQNNSGFDIQIQAATDGKTITTSLLRVN
ncbi:MAG: VanW family protein [Clostridia bacterium]|nr:VanW family protein [Clostridia bacterium]